MSLPIVFLGPSLPHAEASRFLEAEYRPPIRRGDLRSVAANTIVAIIDGVFHHSSAVSPREIRNALLRGVRIFGSSSMGALRAAEVPGVIGIGRVVEMFQSGAIEDDDEVAITFDPESLRPLSEPMVNVRYAVERLARPGTISAQVARAILRAAKKLPYPDRTYPNILRAAGLHARSDSTHLRAMLASHDLKREDAITLLETIPRMRGAEPARSSDVPVVGELEHDDDTASGEPVVRAAANAAVLLWEFGPPIPFLDVVRFLTWTGGIRRHARRAVGRYALAGNTLDVALDSGPAAELVRERIMDVLTHVWAFSTEEETTVSLADLGIGTESIVERIEEEVAAERRVMALARDGSAEYLDALRLELFMDELALKRAAVRAASFRALADRGRASGGEPTAEELRDAAKKLCELLDARDRKEAERLLGWWGMAPVDVDAVVRDLACARRAAHAEAARRCRVAKAAIRGVRRFLRPRRKAHGDGRFCTPMHEAVRITKRLAKVVGVTRTANITGLAGLGVPNVHAYRPDGRYSSTIGGGKSQTLAGARVGAIMEEVEKWAQEQYPREGHSPPRVVASFEELVTSRRSAIDPRSLDLPYDSSYDPAQKIGWRACNDLVSGRSILTPSAALDMEREPHDVMYSARAGRKVLSSNGLASGLSLEEAVRHALCEYVERHGVTTRTILDANPGAVARQPRVAIDLDSVPLSTGKLLRRIRAAGHDLRVFDARADIRVPTFVAALLEPIANDERLFGCELRTNAGHAAHPDPEQAINMAILEATQTLYGNVAAGREDLTLRARSLGRHERTGSMGRSAFASFRTSDIRTVSFESIEGHVSRDAREEVQWVVERVRDAGYPHVLLADLSLPEIAPARVVRVLVPGLETVNPFFTGLGPRLALLADLLPSRPLA